MKETKYNCRTFVNHRNQVIVRVRWNRKKFEVAFSTGLHADPLKWNVETQRPLRGSTHIIGSERNPSRIINERIDMIRGAIDEAFAEYALADARPNADELRDLVNEKTGLTAHDGDDSGSEKSLQDIFNEFLTVNAKERDWSNVVCHRYERVWNQLIACDPEVTLDTLNKDKMIELREWYVKVLKDRNRTIAKQFRTLKSILRWMKANGYPVQESAIEYSPRLTVTKKNVTYLTSKELNHFFKFKFPAISSIWIEPVICSVLWPSPR